MARKGSKWLHQGTYPTLIDQTLMDSIELEGKSP
ncbi:unnamed protein product, partial [Rotaria socialis]